MRDKGKEVGRVLFSRHLRARESGVTGEGGWVLSGKPQGAFTRMFGYRSILSLVGNSTKP